MNTLGVDPMPGIAEKANQRGIETIYFFNLDLAHKIVKTMKSLL